jgi:hypothetical protein
MSEPTDETYALHLGLYLFGGLSLGTGLLFLWYSFGWLGGDMNSDFEQIGFSGLDDISLLSTGEYAIPLVVIGALCLIFANATAWRKTGGY